MEPRRQPPRRCCSSRASRRLPTSTSMGCRRGRRRFASRASRSGIIASVSSRGAIWGTSAWCRWACLPVPSASGRHLAQFLPTVPPMLVVLTRSGTNLIGTYADQDSGNAATVSWSVNPTTRQVNLTFTFTGGPGQWSFVGTPNASATTLAGVANDVSGTGIPPMSNGRRLVPKVEADARSVSREVGDRRRVAARPISCSRCCRPTA